MAFELPRLPQTAPSHGELQVWWQQVVETVEAQEALQDETIARIRRMGSHTVPTTILTATEDGSEATIEVAAHTRVYADGTTLAVDGSAPETGLDCGEFYAVYYDDTTLEDTAPDYQFTTDLPSAMPAAADGRHFCGVILTPEAASGDVIESGGAYPAQNTLFGELD